MSQRFDEPPIGHGSAQTSAEFRAERERKDLQERFETILEGKFDIIRPDQFTSHLPGITALTISRVEAKDGSVPLINITAIGTDQNGRRISLDTVQLTEKGALIGKLGPRMGGVTKNQILGATLDIFASVGLGSYPAYNAGVLILPGEVETGSSETPEPWKGPDHPHNPNRELFLRNIPGSRFMFTATSTGGPGGFAEMYVYVFDKFLYVDCEYDENAAFFFHLEQPITDADCKDMPSPNDQHAFNAWVQQRPWFTLLLRPRKQVRKSGDAFRLYHSGKNWQQRFKDTIARLSK